jgi:26S proteasome regulatory subunit N2
VQPPVVKTPQKLRTAELSVTKKAKIRQRQKEKEKEGKAAAGGDEMDVEKKEEEEKKKAEEEEEENKKKAAAEEEKKKKEAEEKKPEPAFEVLSNPARVTIPQLGRITFDVDERYTPVKKGTSVLGIVLLKDNKAGEPVELVTPAKPPTAEEEDEGDEPNPPEPFEFDPEKEKQ